MKCRYIKRILSFLLAFMILFTTIPFSVYADDEGSGSGSHSSSIGGNAGGGNSSTAQGGGGKGKITVSNDKQGYRFTKEKLKRLLF